MASLENLVNETTLQRGVRKNPEIKGRAGEQKERG